LSKDDAVRLRHMLDAAREAVEFAQGQTRSELDRNRMLVLSLVKDIEIVGEAAFQISPSTRNQLQDIPWDDIIGMRHRLVHAYFDINLDILWRTVNGKSGDIIPISRNNDGRGPLPFSGAQAQSSTTRPANTWVVSTSSSILMNSSTEWALRKSPPPYMMPAIPSRLDQ